MSNTQRREEKAEENSSLQNFNRKQDHQQDKT